MKYGDAGQQRAYENGLKDGRILEIARHEEALATPLEWAKSLARDALHAWSTSGMKDLHEAVAFAIQCGYERGKEGK